MDNKKYKTREEWKDIINSISPDAFQQLCFEIIKKNGFVNPQLRGKGSDGGRDIEAEFEYPVANEIIREKCWFQCKRQQQGVSFRQINTEVQKAEDQGIKIFFIVSNADSTPDCKDDVKNWNEKHRLRISDWTGLTFQDLLFQLPNVCKYYFPDEEIPPIVDIKTPIDIISKSSELGTRLGIELKFKTDRQIDPNNPSEIASALKDALLNLKKVDLNILALLYQKVSMYFFSIEKTDDALLFLNTSLEITPSNTEALLNKGYILEKIYEIEESNNCYDIILKNDNKNKFALNNKAANLMRIGQFEDALGLIDKALVIDSSFIHAIGNKARILKSLNKSKEALAFLDENNELFEKSIILQTSKVDLYIDLLDLKKAYELNERILVKDPNNINALNSRGVIFEKNSKFQKGEKYRSLALECFEEVTKKDAKYPIGWSNKIVVILNSGKLNEAEEIVDIAYEIFPKNPLINAKKGLIQLKKGDPNEAIKFINRALRFEFRLEFLLDLGNAQLALKHWDPAMKTAEKCLKHDPENSDAWFIKGIALMKLHQPKKAAICMKNAEIFKEKPISLLEDDDNSDKRFDMNIEKS